MATDWSTEIKCSETTKSRFNRAKSQIRLEEDQYDLHNDDILNHLLTEAGY